MRGLHKPLVIMPVKVTPPLEFLLFVSGCKRGGCLLPWQIQTRKAEKARKRHFRHYIDSKVTLFPCAFRGIFTFVRVRTSVLGLFRLIVYTRRQKSLIITETRILAGKTQYYHAKVDTRRQNPHTNTETACIITETCWEFS